jgi:hypothetical protein
VSQGGIDDWDKSASIGASATSRRTTSLGRTLEVTVFIATLAALVLGFLIGRYKTYAFRNRSEARLPALYRAKFRFQNALCQNHKHVRAIQELLDLLLPMSFARLSSLPEMQSSRQISPMGCLRWQDSWPSLRAQQRRSCQSIGFSSVWDVSRPRVFQLPRQPTLSMCRDCDPCKPAPSETRQQ